ncbi:uncharacterized protein TNCV_4223461 [Trichonephila clavipes]|nr:uncharacterized protein TNCV_4223461 [Trichonephila clavipes]
MTHPDIPAFYGYNAPSRRGNVALFARDRPQRWGPPAVLTGEGIKLPCVFEAVREIYRNIFGFASFEKVDRFRSEIQLAGHPLRGLKTNSKAATYFMKPRCLKCGKEHATKNCHIKERLTNPFCINCQDFGHSACYTKCPKPKKGTAFKDLIKKKNFITKWTKEGISYANVVSGEIPSQTPPKNNNKKDDSPREFLSQEDNTSDLAQVLELFNIISKLVKKNPKILDLLSKFKNSNSDEEKTCLLAEAIMNI